MKKLKRVIAVVLLVVAAGFLALQFLPSEEESGKKEEKTEEHAENTNDTEKEEKQEEENSEGVSIPQSEISGNKVKFTSTSLDKKSVDESIFADYDLTIVHVWGTFCGPCIEELPEYASLYKELPDNVNLIGVVCDVYEDGESNVSEAKKILKDAGAEFLNLRTSDGLYEVTGQFQYVPSSFFVDKEGHIVGELMDGAGVDDTKKRLDGYLK